MVAIPFFFLVKKYTNRIIGFSLTIMFSFSYYFLQFSRVGWGVIWSTTLGLYLMWTIENMDNKNRILKIILAGILAGLVFYTYRAGEIYIVGSFLFFIIKIFFLKEKNLKKAFYISIFVLLFVLISFPWIIKISSDYENFALRQRVVAIYNTELPYHDLYEKKDILLYQITSAMKSWIYLLPTNTNNVENPRYLPQNYTIINPLLIPLFLIGLILALSKQFKKMYPWFFIYFSGIIFGQIMTIDPPNGARGLIMLPIIYLFTGISLNFFYQKFKKIRFIKIYILSFSIIVTITDFLYYKYWMSWISV